MFNYFWNIHRLKRYWEWTVCAIQILCLTADIGYEQNRQLKNRGIIRLRLIIASYMCLQSLVWWPRINKVRSINWRVIGLSSHGGPVAPTAIILSYPSMDRPQFQFICPVRSGIEEYHARPNSSRLSPWSRPQAGRQSYRQTGRQADI